MDGLWVYDIANHTFIGLQPTIIFVGDFIGNSQQGKLNNLSLTIRVDLKILATWVGKVMIISRRVSLFF